MQDFSKKFNNLINTYPLIGAHGTNSFSYENILSKGLVFLSEENVGFSGENLLKPSNIAGKSVSVSINRDNEKEYPYYLTMSLYYAERVSKKEIPNRNDYITEQLIKKFIIASEGGFENYAKQVLERKNKNYTEEELQRYISETKESYEYLKLHNTYNKYSFSFEQILNFEKALNYIDLNLHEIGEAKTIESPSEFGSYNYYLNEIIKNTKKPFLKGNLEDVKKTIHLFQNRVEILKKNYDKLDTKEKSSLENTYPVVFLFDVEGLDLQKTTSKILCERLVSKIEPQRIIASFTYGKEIKRENEFPIEFLYKLEAEKIKCIT